MKKLFLKNLFAVVLLLVCFSFANATVVEMDADTYTTPDNWQIVAQKDNFILNHGGYYIFGIDDISGVTLDGINIVFHNISNEDLSPNWLNVYFFDNPAKYGLKLGGVDYADTIRPDWSLLNASHLGTWSYIGETKDVVFSTTDAGLLAYMSNGNGFGIGIDPDCSFTGTSITVETNAPVPEPTTLLLIGSGLIGLAGFRRKNS